MSYTAWEPREARVIQPAPVLLEAYRIMSGAQGASYGDLQAALGTPCSARPAEGRASLDGDDVWLGAVIGGSSPTHAEVAVRQAFPRLARGLEAFEAAGRSEASAFRGLVCPRPELLDPRVNREVVLSASRLETLGQCPLRYLFRYAMRIRPPDDPPREPDQWLDPLHRGALLHRVFEQTLREFPDGSQRGVASEVLEHALTVLRSEAERLEAELPAPSESVYRDELRRLRGDLYSFSQAVADDGAPWVELELAFGRDGSDPVTVRLPGGEIRLTGAVDRVDRVAEGLRIVDYKTGSTFAFGAEKGTFYGGRRLQHVLYAEVVEALTGESVSNIEYHFPTPRGRNEVWSFDREAVREGLQLVDRLLDISAKGRFLPTGSKEDCTLCDFGAICRVRHGKPLQSPAAQWGEENFELLPEYEDLRDVRRWEERS